MSTMDDRVVKLTFDNEQFEKKVHDTIKTLQEFEKTLDMKGATAGFDKIKTAADNLNLSAINKQAEESKNKFKDLSDSATKELDSISAKAQNVDMSSIATNAQKAAGDAEKAVSNLDLTGISDAANSSDFSGISSNAAEAISDTEAYASNMDLSAISEETNKAAAGFSNMEAIALGALMSIGNKATDLVENGLRGLWHGITDPITSGFDEYQTQIGSIQTIMANTNMDFDSDHDIERVNATLDELNTYADQTIYNFTEMTRNIGTFTAAGLGLEESAKAIKGIANLAALSGANSNDASRAMYQLSQALASGTVRLQDWMSVEHANMGGQVFQKALADMAVHMADVGKASETAAAAGRAVLEEGEKMRSVLNAKDWGEWLSSDILSETLQTFTYDTRLMTDAEEQAARSHLKTLGYQDDEMDTIFHMAEMATRSATEVRTWQQLMETVGESLGSNWAGIWRNILGDFKQATDTFTFLSDKITSGVDGLLGGIVHMAKVFNGGGRILAEAYGDMMPDGREIESPISILFGSFARDKDGNKYIDEVTGEFARIKGAIDNLFEAVERPLYAIKAAFEDVFGMDDLQLAELMFGLANGFRDFTASLIISEDTMTDVRNIFSGLFSVIDLGLHFVGDLVTGFFSLVDIARVVIDPLLEIAFAIGGAIGKGILTLHDDILLTITSFKIFANELLGPVITAIKNTVTGFFEFLDIPTKIRAFTNFMVELHNILWDFLDIPGKFEMLLQFFQNAGNTIASFFGIAVTEGEQAEIKFTGIAGFFKDLIDGIINAILTVFPFIKDAIDGFDSFIQVMTSGDDVATHNYIVAALENIRNSITQVLGPLFNLGKAIGDFIGRMVEGVSKLDIVQNAISGIASIIDWISNLIGSIGGIREAFASGTEGVSEQASVFQRVGDWIKRLTDIINGLTFDNVIQSFKDLKDGIVDNFLNVVKYFSTTPPSQMLVDFSKGVKKVVKDVVKNLRTMIPAFDSLVKDLSDENIGDKSPFIKFLIGIKNVAKATHDSLVNLYNGISKFTSNVIESIKHNETFMNIINNVKNVFSSFVENVKNSNIGENITQQFSDIASGEAVPNIFNKIAEFFNTLTVDKIIEGAENLRQSIIEKFGIVGQFIEPILTAAIGHFTDFYDKVTTGANSVSDVLKNIRSSIEEAFINLPQTIGGFIDSLFKPKEAEAITLPEVDVVDSIKIDENKIPNILERIANTVTSKFGDMKDVLEQGHGVINNILNGTILNDFVKFVKDGGKATSEIKDGIIDRIMALFTDFAKGLRENQDIISGVLGSGLLISIRQFVKSMKNTTKSLGGMFDAFAGVGKSISNLPKTMADGLTKFAKSLNKWREETPAEAILKIAGAIAVLAASLWLISIIPADSLIRAGQAMGIMAASLLGMITVISLLDKFKVTNKDTLTALGNAFKGIGIGMVGLAAGLMLLTMIPATSLDPVMMMLVKLSGMIIAISLVMKSNPIGTEILKAAAGLLILSFALRSLIKTIEIWNKFDWIGNIRGLAGMAVAIAALCLPLKIAGPNSLKAAAGIMILSVAMLAMIPAIAAMALIEHLVNWDNFLAVMGGLALLMVGIGAGLRLAGEHAISAAAGFLIVSVAINAMAVALGLLSLAAAHGDIVSATVAIGALIVLFGAATKLIKPDDAKSIATALKTFGVGVLAIAAALGVLAMVPIEKLGPVYLMLSSLLVGFWAITKFTESKDLTAAAQAMLKFSGALAIMAVTLAVLTAFDTVKVIGSAGALGVLVLALGAMTYLTKESDLKATSKAILVFALAIAAMGLVLSYLTEFDWTKLLAASGALGVLLLALGAMTYMTKESDVLITSGALMVFAGALIFMSMALTQLAAVPDVTPATVALGALIVVFGVLSAVLSAIPASAAILPLLALALVAFGGTCVLIAFSVNLLATGLEHLAATGPILSQFAQMLAANLGNFAAAALGMAALALGLTVLGVGIVAFGAAALVGSIGIGALTLALSGFLLVAQQMQMFSEAGYNITAGIGEGIGGGLELVTQAILGIGQGILSTILGFFGIASPSTLMAEQVGQYLPAGIAEGINGNSGGLMESLGGTLGELLGRFSTWVNEEALPKLQEFGAGLLDKFKNEILPNIQDWFTNTALPKLGEMGKQVVDHLLEKLGELPGKLWDWAKSLPGKIWDGIQSAWETITSIGSSIIDGIIAGIQQVPDAISDAVVGMASGGLDAIKRFFGIASPSKVMRDEVGRYLPLGLAEGIKRNVSPAVDQAIAMSKSIMDGVSDNIHPVQSAIDIDYDLSSPVSPSISPVIDMSKIDSDLSWLNDMVGKFGFVNSVNSLQTIDANIDMASLTQTTIDQTKRIDELTSQNAKLLTEIGRLRDDMAQYTDAIKNSAIVMDSGILVGALAPQMDQALGMRQSMASRGVI